MKAADYNRYLPKVLHRTDEELRAEQERQNALKPKQVTYDEDVVLYNRAVTDEQLAMEVLHSTTSDDDVEFNRTKLAESYLEQGRFNEAYKSHPDMRYKQWLKKIRDAGQEKCACPKYRDYNEERNGVRNIIPIPTFRLWRTVFNESPYKFIEIYLCNICRAVWKNEP